MNKFIGYPLYILTIFLLVGCQKIEEKTHPQLKIADCDGRLLFTLNDTLLENWDSQDYYDWKSEYDMEQFFYYPVECYNASCSPYANAAMVYENCSIYYLDTKILYKNEEVKE